MKISVSQIRDMAHATVMHYDFLKRQEGKLPASEQTLRDRARTIEATLAGGKVEIEIEEE